MPPRNREGAAYQDPRYAGREVYDPLLGVGGPYLYSFESKLGGVYHKLKSDEPKTPEEQMEMFA